ncbi:efflux RND transporter periplasmic adaptor subunit [Catalinimonas niigatensis]|uniref:efflux RND transporter periplasmic adaptor subunit n=1 Tax=Catalinimonas niigatensis TaxID=1397264 RepID=UPI0026654500|nr:efflux RND transporter periplasmic adaptor subunit [Catalinimonas niigatensis]WPP51874.1 efflux RND transporter periplasmic adaptor subunit [Catalinimonas niigatensis]
MKTIVNNKIILLTIILALVFGGLIGWMAKPSVRHSEEEISTHQHDEHDDEVWTCSMHPQIRQSEPGQCPICGMDLIPASSNRSAADANPMVHEMTPEAVAMANINTSRVTGISPEGELFLTGKVKADEQRLSSVTAKFPGRIEQLFVNFTGQLIQPGQRLATVYSPELLTAQKELLEAIKSKETFPELYTSAREKLRLWKLSEKQIDGIEKTGEVREQFDVLADKGGIVTQRNVAQGDYISTGSVFFNIVDLSRVWIMMDAYETDLHFVNIGDEVSFTVAAVPGKTFSASVSYIDPIINPETRAASVRAETNNPAMELKPEMFVTARVQSELEAQEQSLAIPRTALLWSGKRSIVYIKVPDTEFPSYEMREITIGPQMGEMYLVEAGLEAGEEIVTNGVFAIDAAAQLSGNYSMLMRPESKTIEVPQPFRQQITQVAEAYFEVKNALVEDNGQAAEAATGQVQHALDQVDMRNLKGQAHDHWMMLKEQLEKAADMMQEAENLESQREHFAMLSESILEMTESFGLEKGKVYRDFCPMAFDNQGAFWLSETEEIRNPYFGEQMLTCGEVKETYRKGQRVFAKEKPVAPAAGGTHNH